MKVRGLRLNIIILGWFLAVCANSNVWDNIFSSTQATSPIVFTSSVNFQFPVQEYGVDVLIDYNQKLNTLNVKALKNLIFFSVQVFQLEVDVSQFILSFKLPISECQRYTLALTQQQKNQVNMLDNRINFKSKLFLANIFFQFYQRNKNNKTVNQYILKPDLIMQHEASHQQFQKNVLILVDKQGQINRIYEDKQKRKEIPYRLSSKVTKKMECNSEIQRVTTQDLYKMMRQGFQNKQYEKIPGYDKLPFDTNNKLPNDFKIQDLPISLDKISFDFKDINDFFNYEKQQQQSIQD